MKLSPVSRLALVMGCGILQFGPLLRAADVSPLTVAIMDFETADPKLKEPGTQLAQLVTAQLSTDDRVITVERQDIAKALGEQEIGTSGLVNPATAAQIGQLTGAKVLVLGRLFQAGGETNLVLKTIGTETGRVFGLTTSFHTGAALSGVGRDVAGKLGTLLSDKKSALLAPAPSTPDRIARVKQAIAGKHLPSVSIAIREQHMGPRVIDPAAETEFGLVLGQAGFRILSGEAADRADYHIQGEAFSEAGLQHGNLVSCRARVEVKAIARDGDVVALTDRATTVAVDPAEHIAAKTALQDAAGTLAERFALALAGK